ncbi:MAG: tRNA uridine-5-carboxymethylaminomethyl(34) synthesis GTPase MnmE [Candidatus Marinimicrobia bacterium]|nr:tRNA uridine-5-carboxymethylaminomethyl(34) synthesis GTPase MnmE [Candidatus Neomarinimicrobiota bacterium]
MAGYEGTIAALSTPEGVGGIAVVRVSGPDALNILKPCLSRTPGEPLRATHTTFTNPKDKNFIDDVIVTYFKSPRSYTGEDLVEISCHGGRIIPGLILEVLYAQGARPALPGEFTRRAFINGKMDLAQAEAVADMIHAETEKSLKSARVLLKGRLSRELEEISFLLLDAASLLEIGLDFSDQDIETIDPEEIRDRIGRGLKHIGALIASYQTGRILHDGARIPIIGKPNAGKSSLLNAILKEERVITSDIPGTTRDYIEERINHSGYLLRLFDTAGLRDTRDFIELAGLEKTKKLMKDADLILMITEFPEEVPDIAAYLKTMDTPGLIVLNKIDRVPEKKVREALSHSTPNLPVIAVSALKDIHITVLMDRILDLLKTHYVLNTESVMISHLRHQNHLKRARKALLNAQKALEDNLPPEFIAMDIRDAMSALDDITGKTTSPEILNHIFSRFCIGK